MKHRLFVAIDLPQGTKDFITGLQAELGKLALPIRWEDPEKLHLTVNFLGKIDSDQISAISRTLTAAANSYSPFPLTPVYLQTMYKKHADSFIYLGLSGDLEILKELQKSLSQSFSDLSIPQPDRFFPHILIGRFVKADPVFIKKSMDAISEFDFFPPAQISVAALTLYESFLSQKGSYYRRIGHFRLG